MKKLILLFVIFMTTRAMAAEDDCLALLDPHCPALGWFNECFILVDTCLGKNELYARYFRFTFEESVFSPNSEDILNYKEIETIWQKLPQEFDGMRNSFKEAYLKYGNYYLEKEFPYIDDPNSLVARSYYLILDKYNSVNIIQDFFWNVDNISKFTLKGMPACYPEAFSLNISIEKNHGIYPELHIYNRFGFNSWCEDTIFVEIYRKSFHETKFNLIKKLFPSNHSSNNPVSFEVNFTFIDEININPGEIYYYKARAHAINNNCNTPFSGILSVKRIIITGYTSFCQNDVENYSVPANPKLVYQWYITKGRFSTASNKNWVQVLWDSVGIGTLKLVIKGNEGFMDSTMIDVKIHPLPPKPIITRDGDSLFSSADYGTRWYCDSNLIGNEIGKRAILLSFDNIHNYSVMQIDSNGCSSEMSEPFYFVPYSSVKEESSKSLIVLPNPASDNISISFPGGINQSIHIYNSLGIEIKRFEEKDLFEKNSIDVSVEEFPSGIYYVRQDIGCLPDIQCLTKSFVVIR